MFHQNQLKFGAIDQFPFVGKYFSVNVQLMNEVKDPSVIGDSVPFSLKLFAGESMDQLTVLENGIEIEKKSKLEIPISVGSCQVNVKIMQPSGVSLFSARKFFLVAQPTQSAHFQHVQSCFSDPLVAVNYRLIITNGHELPAIYYNATKGKGNKMELKVKLVDSEGKIYLGRPNLKLNFVLHYEDNQTVDQTEKKILEISSDSKLFIGDTGETSVRFRIINAVSRKHGNRRFKLSVSADSVQNAARYNDVSFDYSPSVDVRTKVDEKARARRMASKRHSPQQQENYTINYDSLQNDSNPEKIPKLERGGPVSFTGPVPTFSSPTFSAPTYPPFSAPSFSMQPTFSATPSLGIQTSYGLSSSYSGPGFIPQSLIAPAPPVWGQYVLDQIERIRWKKSTSTDRDIDPNRQVYSFQGYKITNPNDIIDEIVKEIHNAVRMPSYSDMNFTAACQTVSSNVAPLPFGLQRVHSLMEPPLPSKKI